MCGCKNCKEVTLLGGLDGVGIASIVSNSFGTVTYNYTNGSSVTLPCSCAQSQVYYRTERLGINTSGTSPTYAVATNMTYTIPTGAGGVYEVDFASDVVLTFTAAGFKQVDVQIFKNGLEIDPNIRKRAKASNSDADGSEFIIPITAFVSNVTLAAGDIITVVSTSTAPASAYLNFGVMKVKRLS